MRVRPVDPQAASAGDVAAMHDLRTATLSHDEPDRRRPGRTEFAAELVTPWPGTRTAWWVIEDEVDGPIGMLTLTLPRVEQTLGYLEFAIRPDRRRRGVGRALLREAVRAAYAEGRDSLVRRTLDRPENVAMLAAVPARAGRRETRSVLDVRAVEVAALPGAPPEYEFLRLSGETPPEHLPGIAQVHVGMGDAPRDASEAAEPEHDAARIAEFDQMLDARGMTQLRVLACHRGSDRPVGVTYVIVPSGAPSRSEQGDTVVDAAHRGRGLATALKAEMLRWLHADFPRVAELTTWVASNNGPIRAVNRALGYRDAASYTHWQVAVSDATTLLGLR